MYYLNVVRYCISSFLNCIAWVNNGVKEFNLPAGIRDPFLNMPRLIQTFRIELVRLMALSMPLYGNAP